MRASTAVPSVLLEENPAHWPEFRDRAGTAAARGNLGLLTTPQVGYARAMLLCEEALAGDRDLEDRHGAGQPRACPLPLNAARPGTAVRAHLPPFLRTPLADPRKTTRLELGSGRSGKPRMACTARR
jgi:hypothetical protein